MQTVMYWRVREAFIYIQLFSEYLSFFQTEDLPYS